MVREINLTGRSPPIYFSPNTNCFCLFYILRFLICHAMVKLRFVTQWIFGLCRNVAGQAGGDRITERLELVSQSGLGFTAVNWLPQTHVVMREQAWFALSYCFFSLHMISSDVTSCWAPTVAKCMRSAYPWTPFPFSFSFVV